MTEQLPMRPAGNKRAFCKRLNAQYPDLHITWKPDTKEFRIAHRNLSTRGTNEASAYYATDMDDAIGTAAQMSVYVPERAGSIAQ